jgi:hypothetical protein
MDLKPAHGPYHALERSMIALEPIVEIFDLPVLKLSFDPAFLLQPPDSLSVSLFLILVDRFWRAISTVFQRFAEKEGCCFCRPSAQPHRTRHQLTG